jgi:hypothetical protein
MNLNIPYDVESYIIGITREWYRVLNVQEFMLYVYENLSCNCEVENCIISYTCMYQNLKVQWNRNV